MTDTISRPAAAPAHDEDLTDFAPAPARFRHDGWTAERQRAFIAALSEYGCVSDACQAVGINARSAYKLRRRPGAEAFDAAWDQALVVASHRLTTLAFERAVYGSTRQIWKDGVLVAEERRVSDRLLIFLLQHFDKMRYGKLSGLLPVPIGDPRGDANAALPKMLAALTDQTEPAEPLGPVDYLAVERARFDDR